MGIVALVSTLVCTTAERAFANEVKGTISTASNNLAAKSKLAVGLSYGDVLSGMNSTQIGAALNDAVALGATEIRLDLSWADVQPVSRRLFQWGSFDRVVAAAASRHLSLLPILDYTPAWARPKGCNDEKCRPNSFNEFASFAHSAASRYAPRGIHVWEVWNEPNITNFWQPAPSAREYTGLLSATARALRMADPLAIVASGGLAPAATSGGNISQLDFLDQFGSLGGFSLVNAIGYHPYSYPVLANNPIDWNAWSQISSTKRSFVSILRKHGYPRMPIWLTEYGAPTGGPGVQATSLNAQIGRDPDHVDERTQAQMATQSVKSALTTPNVRMLIWYSDRDAGTSRLDSENFFGIRRFNGQPKPAYWALKVAFASVRS